VTAPTGTISYEYDPVGNRTNRTSSVSGITNQVFSYNTNDWLTSDVYDNNGNTRTNGTNVYQYDYANRLTNANNGAVVITYDADGNRVRKLTATTTNLYLVATVNPSGYAQVVEELTVSGGATNLSKIYTYGMDLISQRQAPSGTVHFFGYDGLGSTRFLLDTSGSAVETYAYDAFGTMIASNTTPSTPYLFAREQWDSHLRFCYLRARLMNPSNGRFATADAFEGNQGDPLSLHRYLYARANPANATDPTGFESYVGFNVDGWNGYGHVGIITHNPTNGVYTRFDHAHGVVAEKTNNSARRLFLGYHILFIIPDQYDSALDTARKNYKKRPGGSTISNNCRTSVMEIFDAAGVPHPPDPGFWPNSWLISFWNANYGYVLMDRKGFNFLRRIVYQPPPTFGQAIMYEFTSPPY